jgi:hypothetical protein
MLKFNEGRVCDAIIRLLEERVDARRSNVHLHDEDSQPDRRVELTFNLAGNFYAMEHTGIEPFYDFMRMNRTSGRLFDPIISAVSNAVAPNEVIHLNIPIGVLTRRNKKDLESIRHALVKFILESATNLPLHPYGDWRGVEPTVPPGVPFQVRLARFASPIEFPGRFHLGHLVSDDVELLRAERLRQSCEDKFPKLASWKASHHARTVLVLEDNDIQLTNEMVVAAAYLKIALARDDRPDETYVVATHAPGGIWFTCPILIENDSYFDLSERFHPIPREIDSARLNPITRR